MFSPWFIIWDDLGTLKGTTRTYAYFERSCLIKDCLPITSLVDSLTMANYLLITLMAIGTELELRNCKMIFM